MNFQEIFFQTSNKIFLPTHHMLSRVGVILAHVVTFAQLTVLHKYFTFTRTSLTLKLLPPQPLLKELNEFYSHFSGVTKEDKSDNEIEQLKAMFRDKSIGYVQKFKILFQQYGSVLIGVYVTTTAMWLSSIYYLLSMYVVASYINIYK